MSDKYFRHDAIGPTNLSAFRLQHMARERYFDGIELKSEVVGPVAQELLHTISGRGKILIDDGSGERWIEVGPGSYFLCDEKSRKVICGVENWRLDWYDFTFDDAAYLPKFRPLRLDPRGTVRVDFETLSGLFLAESLWDRRRASALFAGMIMGLAAAAEHEDAGLSHAAADPAASIQRVFDTLTSDFKVVYTVDQMADLAGMSISVFRKEFQRIMGIPPKMHYDKLRMDHALRLLAEGMKIKEVAVAIGFTDPFHFSRSFRRLRGHSPRNVRGGFRRRAAEEGGNY